LAITSPSLTILDLAGTLGKADLAAATLVAHPKRRGARALRALLESERGQRVTRSEAERRALVVMREHGLEPDSSDVKIGPYRVDFLFERERVAVEIDGYRYHGTTKRFVDDRRRTATSRRAAFRCSRSPGTTSGPVLRPPCSG
jgi:very-short-patch-repair endonuclease